MNILVTGVGGAIGTGIVEALRLEFNDEVNIIGCDSSNLSPLFYLKNSKYKLNKKHVVPEAKDRTFIPRILEICEMDNIDLIFPGTDHELLPFSEEIEQFYKRQIKVIVSPFETISICRNKRKFFEVFKDKLPIAKTYDFNSIKDSNDIEFPLFAKPIQGWGSRNTYKINNPKQLELILNMDDKFVIQEYLPGKEYTIDVLTDVDGHFLSAIPRERIQILGGLSGKSKTVHNETLIDLARKICNITRFSGPFNFQVKISKCGRPKIIEINPRFAGTGILSVYAGLNIPAISVKIFMNQEYTIPEKIAWGKTITRYIENVFLDENDLI